MSDRLYDLFPEKARDLLEVRGIDLADKLGKDAVRKIVTDVLSGVNVRNATEPITRRRVAHLNAALLVLFMRAREGDEHFPEDLLGRVKGDLLTKGLSTSERRVLGWLIGLTKKQIDNVLRADPSAWDDYLDLYGEDLKQVAVSVQELHSDLTGSLDLAADAGPTPVTWLWALWLLQAVGTQERATRGSEKSLYGKFFEKPVLGGALHVLGLRMVDKDDGSDPNHVFWLSSRGAGRESDATALFGPGKGVRFDIGFIGTGNPEIVLDKITRFEREAEIGGETTYMGTIIVVDKIGNRSRIKRMADKISASVVQMSASYWPRDLARELEESVDGFESPFTGMSDAETEAYILEKMKTAPFEDILGSVTEDADMPEATD